VGQPHLPLELKTFAHYRKIIQQIGKIFYCERGQFAQSCKQFPAYDSIYRAKGYLRIRMSCLIANVNIVALSFPGNLACLVAESIFGL
jgi:hypothetical protein